ncbi:MAG: response regulator, partial [Alphaproteobacteria bacterium]|nr:response regulator [Alphaproteobacteria bacterium]
VSDTGAGMPPDVIARAFEPFFTTKEVGKGSGLGLSMVYGFARQSGGDVTIESTPGQGTAVRLYLPASTSRPTPPPADPSDATVSGSGETIIVVEDAADVRGVVVKELTAHGYKVLTAANGSDALTVLSATEKIDMLLTDIVLPGGMTGVELAERAREAHRHLAVLYMSGFSDALQVASLRIRKNALLSKPFGKNELLHAIRQGLRTARQRLETETA